MTTFGTPDTAVSVGTTTTAEVRTRLAPTTETKASLCRMIPHRHPALVAWLAPASTQAKLDTREAENLSAALLELSAKLATDADDEDDYNDDDEDDDDDDDGDDDEDDADLFLLSFC